MEKNVIDSISTCYYFCNLLIPLQLCNVCAMFVCIDTPNVQISFKSSKLQSFTSEFHVDVLLQYKVHSFFLQYVSLLAKWSVLQLERNTPY